MARNDSAMPLSPLAGCAPGCGPTQGRVGASITPVISVSSVNGESGDIVLKKLIVGNKEYNGSNEVEVTAKDLSLDKAVVYVKALATKDKVLEALSDAKTGDMFFCKADKLFYLSVGEGDYKTIASGLKLEDYALATGSAARIALEVNPDTFEMVSKLYDKDGNLIYESEPVVLPSGMDDAIKGGYFDNETDELVFILKNDSEVRVPLAGLVDDFQKKITPENKLAFGLVEGLAEFKVVTNQAIATEVEQRTSAIAAEAVDREAAITAESTIRANADSELSEKLDAEIEDRINADEEFGIELEAETEERKVADNIITDALNDEVAARTELEQRFNEEVAAREESDAALSTAIANEVADREAVILEVQNSLNIERNNRISNDADIRANLASEVNDRILRDSQFEDKLIEEVSARESNDILLQQAIYDETEARTLADANLQGNLDLEQIAREEADAVLAQALAEEATARQDQDTVLQQNIDAEAVTRQADDDALSVALGEETTAREEADADLQEQIDNIPVYSVVKDENPGEFSAVYHLTKDGVNEGSPIQIAKDFLVKDAQLKTVEQPDVPYEGAQVGDKYIDFVINSKDAVDPAKEKHIYLPVRDLMDIYTAGAGLVLSNNQFSIRNEVLDKINQTALDLATEIGDRTDADTHLQTEINHLAADVQAHVTDLNNPHQVTKAQVGLGNADNTADIDKPVSTAVQLALDAETSARESADTVNRAELENLIQTEADDRAMADNEELQARLVAESNLQQQITNTVNALGAETVARGDADAELQAQIDAINSRKTNYATAIICDGTSKVYTVAHNLGTYDVIVQAYDLDTYNMVVIDNQRVSANQITFTFKEAPVEGKKYRVMCYGICEVVLSPVANGGTGTMSSWSATKGIPFTLPACAFTAPDGYEFDVWAIGSVSGEQVPAGGVYTFNSDTIIYALWKVKVEEVNMYYGAVPEGTVPTSVEGLTPGSKSKSELLSNGFIHTFTLDEQVPVFAISKSLGLYIDLSDISAVKFEAAGQWWNDANNWSMTETSGERIYYSIAQSSDMQYQFFFKEV